MSISRIKNGMNSPIKAERGVGRSGEEEDGADIAVGVQGIAGRCYGNGGFGE